MTTLSTSARLAVAAAMTLLLAPVHNAEAKSGNMRMAFGAVTTGTAKPTQPPLIRDHRRRTPPGTALHRRCTFYAGQRVCTSTW